jgi:hypothetical protein
MMATYRFDEDFDGFLADFGNPHDVVPAEDKLFQQYETRLPARLFEYWRGVGFCGFAGGLVWITNPVDYEDLLDSWFKGTKFEGRDDFAVIARSAFGVLQVWERGKGKTMTINPNIAAVYYTASAKPVSSSDENKYMQYWWGGKDLDHFDQLDSREIPMFQRAVEKLGRLKKDEMYGFAHSPALGGKFAVENLEIVKLGVHHDIARQMQGVRVVVQDI